MASVSAVEGASPDDDAVYSFSAVVAHELATDRSQVRIIRYEGRGEHVSGRDRGPIVYRLAEPIDTTLRRDRTFAGAGRLIWSDADDAVAEMATTLRGTVLETGELAFFSATFRGTRSPGSDIAIQIPAGW